MALAGAYIYVAWVLLEIAQNEAEEVSVIVHEIHRIVAQHFGARISCRKLANIVVGGDEIT